MTCAKGGSPQRVSTALSDIATGLSAALAICASVVRQRHTGQGDLIDASLRDSDLALMAPQIASFLAGEPEPAPSGGTDSVLAVYQPFPTADRSIVVAGVPTTAGLNHAAARHAHDYAASRVQFGAPLTHCPPCGRPCTDSGPPRSN